MPFGGREREVLAAAAAIITTSDWTRTTLSARYGLAAVVAEPGVDAAPLAPGSAAGDALLCVAAVTPGKGHDVLLDALAPLEGWYAAFGFEVCGPAYVEDEMPHVPMRRRR